MMTALIVIAAVIAAVVISGLIIFMEVIRWIGEDFSR